MFNYFILLCLGASFCAYAHEERFGGRIIGGHPVQITKYPYQVSLQMNGEHGCGGSIIDNRFILTAAHCVKNLTPKNLKVRVGSSYHNSGGQLIEVENYEAIDESDTAVLKLTKNIKMGVGAQPIKLNTNFGQSAELSGWGQTKNSGKDSKQLQAISINIISPSDCGKRYGINVLDTNFCAGVVGGDKESCQIDSGGSLVVNGLLYGIVSKGDGCGRPNYPGLYVDVAKMGPWIEDTMVNLNKN